MPPMIHPASSAVAPTVPSPPGQVIPQLRRATYIHVSDLTNAYNMDHARLEEELAHARTDQDRQQTLPPGDAPTSTPLLHGGVPTELDTSHTQRRLQPPRAGFNLCVLVGQVKLVVDKKRVDGSRVRLAEVEVGDETGVVSLRARDDQIDLLQEVSAREGTVVLRNCTLELYQGKHIRLAVTKWGKISRYPDQVASTPPPPSKINRDRNFSLIDLTIVASEMVGETYPYTQQQSSPESDNQSSSMGPRTPQYNNPQTRNNKGGRRPPTYNKAGVQVSGLVGQPGHYKKSQGLQPAYHVGMQGYAEVSPYSYGHVQPESFLSPQHQYLYQRQQYEMQQQQQRQLQQMYLASGERQSASQSPMSMPLVCQASSFDSFSGPTMTTESHGSAMGSFPLSTQTPSRRSGGASTPLSPGMNPRATTFDPTRK